MVPRPARSDRSVRLRALSVLSCLLLGSLAAPALGRSGPVFEDEAYVVLVEVPVNVVRDGQPVRGLTADDFRVFDGREERPLVGFEVVDLEAVERSRERGEAAEVPMSARRHFLLLFDLDALGGAELQRAVDGGKQLLASDLHATDLVGVGVYGRRQGASLLVGFTPDRRQVADVLDQFQDLLDGKPADEGPRAGTARPVERDPLGLMMGGSLSDLNNEDLAGAFLGGMSGRGAMNADTLGDMSRISQGYDRERERSVFAAKADALSRLADATAALEGRKYLVLFSEDVDSELFMKVDTQVRSLLDNDTGARSLRDLDELTRRFQRAGWSVQAVDAGASAQLAAGGAFLQLAEETGGEAWRNFNDLGGAMDSLLGKSSVTYLLAFQVEDVRNDGKFHPIDVELRDGVAGRGARLYHRTGYAAPDEDAEDMGRTLSMAEMILSGESSGDLPVSTLMASFHGDADHDGKAHVTTWVDVPGAEVLAASTGSKEPVKVEVFAYVLDDDYEIHDFFTHQVRLDLAKVGERLRDASLTFYGTFDVPPGSYDLRLLVRHDASGRHALASYPFQVPADDGQPSVLPPFFLDDRPDGVVVRERQAEGTADRYPYRIGDGEAAEIFVPDVDPVVVRDAGPSRVCLMGYQLDRAGLLLEANLVAADGTALDPQRLAVVGRGETTAGGLDRLYLSLETAGLATGDYQLQVSIHDPDSGLSQQTFMPFRVVG